MHRFWKGAEEHQKIRGYSRLPFDRDFRERMVLEKFEEKYHPAYQHQIPNPEILKRSIRFNKELTENVQEVWVRHSASGLVLSENVATDKAVDTSGNVYVTGYSTKPPFGVDFLTVKYNASGVQVWSVRYDAGGDDIANAIAVDGAGNVYVTGFSYGSGTWEDYATIKYNSAGVQQWFALYNGPGNSSNAATAIAVDGAGNVYVTGNSSGIKSSIYTTIKYTQRPRSEDQGEPLPTQYELSQNYPNPFNPITNISFSLPTQSFVSLKIFDALGREVTTLVNEELPAGNHKYQWNAVNIPSGVYFYQLQAGSFNETKKLVLMK